MKYRPNYAKFKFDDKAKKAILKITIDKLLKYKE